MGRIEEDAAHAAAWEGLLGRGHMADHWSAHGWRPDDRRLSWFLTLAPGSLREEIVRLQEPLNLPFLDPLAPDALHLTVQGIAGADEVDAMTVDALAVEARRRLAELRPFALELEGVNAFDQGVVLQVFGWPPLLAVRRGLREAITAVLGPSLPGDAEEGFFPHVSLAYANGAGEVTEVVGRVAALRDAHVGMWTVDHVDLVELRRGGHAYEWDLRHRVPIGVPLSGG